jgi:putative addiction module component (TIGR02574 family)
MLRCVMVVRAELMSELLRLPENERAELAAALLDSLDGGPPDDGVAAAWDDEIERRARDDEEGTAEWIDGAEALRQARAELDPREP